jgi:hypothetical protein
VEFCEIVVSPNQNKYPRFFHLCAVFQLSKLLPCLSDLSIRVTNGKLNTKNLGKSPIFLTITHMTLSAKRFRSYGTSTIDIAAEFCSWTEQRWNGSSLFYLRLAQTLDPQITFRMITLSAFRWSIKWLQTVSDLRVTAVRNSTGRLISISGRSYLPI